MLGHKRPTALFPKFLRSSYVVRQLVRQHVYTRSISSNRTSIHLWRKENLVKHPKVSKYYETDCLQNFLLFFMFLSTAKSVKSSHI